MRVNSPKQTKASRANGSKSKGPKSQAGKSKAAQNAIQDGVFARQIVIEQLGEKQAEFEKTKKLLWDFFQSSNTVEEMLVSDYVENWWRRERIRRSEAIELRNRLAALNLRSQFEAEDKVEALGARPVSVMEARPRGIAWLSTQSTKGN
jgi:hypothetical protein